MLKELKNKRVGLTVVIASLALFIVFNIVFVIHLWVACPYFLAIPSTKFLAKQYVASFSDIDTSSIKITDIKTQCREGSDDELETSVMNINYRNLYDNKNRSAILYLDTDFTWFLDRHIVYYAFEEKVN